MSLAVGAFIAWQRPRPLLRSVVMIILAVQIYLLLPGSRNHLYTQLILEQPREMDRLRQLVHQADGPVLADVHMGFLPLEGRALYVQPFEATQLARAGSWDQTPFLEAIQRQEFPMILMLRVSTPFGPLHETIWSPEMLAAINEYYMQTDLIADTTFIYRPKAN